MGQKKNKTANTKGFSSQAWRWTSQAQDTNVTFMEQWTNLKSSIPTPPLIVLDLVSLFPTFEIVWPLATVTLDQEKFKGSHPERKVKFFWTLFKRPLTPPPFYLNICPILQGVFFEHVYMYVYVCSSPHLKCCINVGIREAPCKKSFGILASYWTPPKIK